MKLNFEKFFQQKNDDGKKKPPSKKIGYIIILGLVGLLLIILGNVFSSPSEPGSDNQMGVQIEQGEQGVQETSAEESVTSDVDELESSYEKDLEAMLNKIQGVSETEVMINLDSTNVKVYEKNLIKGQQKTDESDKNGGTRIVEDHTEDSQTVLVRQGDKEVPLLRQTKRPEVRGVFVVAKGADHATVKQWMIEAISRVLDVPTHRVSVMPKN
ncbi:stage III sporulation protein AG [Virgibacillus profundi]|uniref:stage III sporulation protein AG n=1 Tax=Virgibacillus profundi TaxID=2024555 RepID=UPI001F0A58C5|nr:stage III sporulation protein AG [Virgibacillus profundi]